MLYFFPFLIYFVIYFWPSWVFVAASRLSLGAGCELLIAGISFVEEHRLLGERASVVSAHGLSCPSACVIFLDQRENPCPLRWQVDS